jgi:dipeptidyl aminopeptidase/acylaminoacyl peptidase
MKKILIPAILIMLITSCNTEDKNGQQSDGDFSNLLTPEEITNARFTPEILWKFGRVGEMELAPDGSAILYTVTRYDAKTDKRHTWIYSVPANGGEPENLTSNLGSCANPRWIDNDNVAFLCKSDERMQIWTMKRDGSDPQVISDIPGDVNAFGFAPDGRKIFYTQDVKLDSTTQDIYPDLPLAKGMVFEDLMYRHWDSWTDYSYSHIFISHFENGKIKAGNDIMEGEHFDSPLSPYFSINEIAWSPDGNKLAYTCKKLTGRAYSESTNSDIYVYNEGGNTVNITEGMPGYEKYPVFSPDGSRLAFMSMETPGYEADKERLFVYDFNTKEKTYLTADLDQNAAHFSWTEDSKKIFFISGIKATYQVFEFNAETKTFRQITQGVHDYTGLSYSNGVLAGTRASMTMPAEVFRIDPESGKETQLTFTNKNIFDVIKKAQVEERWVKTTDGKDMLVWLILPPDFDSTKKYPALLFCQGGPQSAVSQSFSFRWNFQLMASQGYIVVAPNRRGLPTFGQEWNAQISGDYGGQNIKDYLSAIDAVSKEPFVDADHLGAVGASYGGYSVLYLAGHHQKRFKAFIAHCGMFNLESQSAATDEMFFVHHDLGGYAWDNPKPVSYTKYSPHLYVDKWDTPIMLVSGMNDFRIPYTESLQAFNAAQLKGIPSKLLIYPDESHWVLKPQNSILWQREYFGWLDRWLK